MPHARALLIACLGAALLLATSCGEHMAFEVRTSSTGGYAGAGGTGGGSSGGSGSKTGGASSGGGAGTGTGSKSGTGASSGGCTETCRGATPYCDAGECVACRDADDCKKADKPFCAESTKSCVECEEHESCTDLSKPVCEAGSCTGCTESPQCARFSETPVCDEASGMCVGCLTEADCDGKVCDPRTHECTEFDAHALNACRECEYDAQCRVGQVCVEMTYTDTGPGVVGRFCQWLKDAAPPGPNGTCGLSSQPYARQAEVVSVDGVPATICTLRTTTCPAFVQHAKAVSGCDDPYADDSACGAEGFNDGRCRRVNPESESSPTMCSYPCGGNEDCRAGFTCPSAGDQYCSL